MKAVNMIRDAGRKAIPYIVAGSICFGAGIASKENIDYSLSARNSPRISVAYTSRGAVIMNKDSGTQYPVIADAHGMRIGSIDQRIESLEIEATDALIVSDTGGKILEGVRKIERRYYETAFSGKNVEQGFSKEYLDLHKSVRMNAKGNIEVYLTDAKHTERLTEDFQLGETMYRIKGLYAENRDKIMSTAQTLTGIIISYFGMK